MLVDEKSKGERRPWLKATQFRRVYNHTEHTDRIITAAYQSPKFGAKKNASVKAMCATLGWPKYVCYRRAIVLGVAQPRRKAQAWSEDEMRIVEANAHLSVETIQKKLKRAGFARSRDAIGIRIKRFCGGVRSSRIGAGIMTASDVAVCLGIDRKTVGCWIERGILAAKRTGSGWNDHWEVTEKELKSFIRDNPERIVLAKVDRSWFIELLTR